MITVITHILFVGDQLCGAGFVLRQTGCRAEALHLYDDVFVLDQLKQLVDRRAGLHRADELFFGMARRILSRCIQHRLPYLYLQTFQRRQIGDLLGCLFREG